jgi:CHAT domain-containing protein
MIGSKPDSVPVDYRNLDYLIKHFPIRYAYSSGTAYLDAAESRIGSRWRILAMEYGSDNEPGEGKLPGLYWSGPEMDSIRRFLKGRFIRYSRATETNFKRWAPDYQLIHLSLHGHADTAHHERTMLIFRNDPLGRDDGHLLPEELYTLSLQARLVVLSSCETGTGKEFRGEGVYSMARAFAMTGCPALVATLWPIPDRQAAALVAGFYRELAQGFSPAEALRKAKLEYLRRADPLTAHPLFWASFISIGAMVRLTARGV